jgi:hypothetical protein
MPVRFLRMDAARARAPLGGVKGGSDRSSTNRVLRRKGFLFRTL